MSRVLTSIEPQAMWRCFEDLNAVPRASKKEERIIAFIKNFGKTHGLTTVEDHVGNVLIKKPASKGMEDRPTVVMQSHLDMVHQKNEDTTFDFDKQGIQMFIEGDWVKAKGTTLGADNGIGVASIMAILASEDIDHPPIEALFTIDEETGLTGANALQPGMLTGKYLLNLDTEDDTELTIGCAGGIDVTCEGTYELESIDMSHYKGIAIKMSGLTGGHSGMDIHIGRGNANKLMNRMLFDLLKKFGVKIASIEGGGLRNAIPRESKIVVAVPLANVDAVIDWVSHYNNICRLEYKTTDPELIIEATIVNISGNVLGDTFTNAIVAAIYACPNGIYRMSPDVAGLVQSSNNLSRVRCMKGKYEILCLTRSSVDTEKYDVVNAIKSAMHALNGQLSVGGDYPGWTANPHATIVTHMENLYIKMFGTNPHVNACHAGLECGILGRHYPEMEMISFGPNIRGAHSPDEKVQISSVQKYWSFLLETLRTLS